MTTARANARSRKQCLLAFANDAANRNRPLEPVHLLLSFFSISTVSAEYFKQKAKAKKSLKALSAIAAEKLGPGGKALVHLPPFYSKSYVVNAPSLLAEHTTKALAKLAHLRPRDRLNGANLPLAT